MAGSIANFRTKPALDPGAIAEILFGAAFDISFFGKDAFREPRQSA
jgi:hypothetical protein